VKGSAGYTLLACVLVGCASSPSAPAPPKVSTARSAQELAAAIATDSSLSDEESDSKVRAQLAADASRDAEECLSIEPQAAACLFGRAVAQGLSARAHPTKAGELLNAMLASLASAEAVDPNYDQAGPARVRALVLLRSPGWPLGPGDPEAGLVAARRAVALNSQYPPNLLALAEALAKNGDAKAARENYQQARTLAQALPESADRDTWLREADEALRRQ
jgi:hypothetical protein